MIGSTYKQRDGGWSVAIHGSESDVNGFSELMQWLLAHEVKVTEEVVGETKRIEVLKLFDEVPNVSARLDALSTRMGLSKSWIIDKALAMLEVGYVEKPADPPPSQQDTPPA